MMFAGVSPPILIIGLFVITALLLILQWRRVRQQESLRVEQHAGFADLRKQVGRAIESGRELHISLGRGGLNRVNLPASAAAQRALEQLAEESVQSGTPPLVTTGDGTLLPWAQATVKSTYMNANREEDYISENIQFVADETSPFAYAAGVGAALRADKVGGNVLMGHFGSEVGLMADSAARANIEQVIGSDDPTALAVASAYTDHVLIGETFLATEAQISQNPSKIASLQVQNLLRIVVTLIILGVAVLGLLG